MSNIEWTDEDDEDVILLESRRRSLLNELQTIDAELSKMAAPERRLSDLAFRLWRQERARLVERKNQVQAEYRQTKASLVDRRHELRRAATDVERDLTDPKDLIEALLDAAIGFGAYADPRHQETIDAAKRWLGRYAP